MFFKNFVKLEINHLMFLYTVLVEKFQLKHIIASNILDVVKKFHCYYYFR